MHLHDPRRFTVLAVCTGNICRSPATALLLQSALGGHGIVARSVGTLARPGVSIAPEIAQLLADDRVASWQFASSPLTEEDLRRSDLVLALAREHRSRVVSLLPAALRRTYTLKEFARLATAVDPADLDDVPRTPTERLRALTTLAGRHRSPVPPEADDVADPFGGSLADYRTAYDEIRDAVTTIVRVAVG